MTTAAIDSDKKQSVKSIKWQLSSGKFVIIYTLQIITENSPLTFQLETAAINSDKKKSLESIKQQQSSGKFVIFHKL